MEENLLIEILREQVLIESDIEDLAWEITQQVDLLEYIVRRLTSR